MSAEIITANTLDLCDEKTLADFLGVATGTLAVWRSTGRHSLPFIKVGRSVRYSKSAVIAWLEQRTRETGATA